MRRLLRLGILLAPAVAAFAAPSETPPAQVITAEVSGTAASSLRDDAQRTAGRQSSATAGFLWLERRPFGSGPWYFGWGALAQGYSFSGTSALPLRQLEEVSGQLTLEYYIGADAAAYLGFRPGFYFERHPSAASWDAPVELETGFPVTHGLAGAVGFTWGRLYHHPIPIFGLDWTVSPQLRIEAVFPEPAIVFTVNPQTELRLTGELIGDGFKTDPGPTSTRVEYYAYRVGAKFSHRSHHGTKISIALGAEVEREFDFYQIGRRFHGRPAPYFEIAIE